MTGQYATNAERVRQLAEAGLHSRQISERLGICTGYVRILARNHGIKIPRKPKKVRPPRREKRGRPRGTFRATITPRTQQMAAMYQTGKTLQQIGDHFAVTRERVRQIITRFHGLSRLHGGIAIAAKDRKLAMETERDNRCFAKWGCCWNDYVALRDLKKPTRAYSAQRKNAGVRGIEWRFTLWEWWTVWQQSGRWDQRGRGQGYVMCRKGDTGPYSADNVYIATAAQNSSEGQRKRKIGGKDMPVGVSIKNNRYVALRSLHGKKLYLGAFATVEQAHAAYLSASLEQRSAA